MALSTLNLVLAGAPQSQVGKRLIIYGSILSANINSLCNEEFAFLDQLRKKIKFVLLEL